MMMKTCRPPLRTSTNVLWIRNWRQPFDNDVILSRLRPWHPPAARCCISSVYRLPSSPPSACDVTGSQYAIQFLIHVTIVHVIIIILIIIIIITVVIVIIVIVVIDNIVMIILLWRMSVYSCQFNAASLPIAAVIPNDVTSTSSCRDVISPWVPCQLQHGWRRNSAWSSAVFPRRSIPLPCLSRPCFPQVPRRKEDLQRRSVDPNRTFSHSYAEMLNVMYAM